MQTGTGSFDESEERTPAESECDDTGSPRNLPIRRKDGKKFSEVYSPAICERLKKSRLGGAPVFDPNDF